MATQPLGHGGRSVRFTTLLTAFAFLAGRACALASDAATTARTQRTPPHSLASQDYCLWALVPICPGSRFAGCGAVDCMRWTKPLLDLNVSVERVHLPIFTPLFPREDTFCQGRSIFVSLFPSFPSFPSSSLRPDRGSKGHPSPFLFACSYLVAYPVGSTSRSNQPPTRMLDRRSSIRFTRSI